MFDKYYFNDDGEKVYFHEEHGMRFEWMKAEDILVKNGNKTPVEYANDINQTNILNGMVFLGYYINSSKQWNSSYTKSFVMYNNVLYNTIDIERLKKVRAFKKVKFNKSNIEYYFYALQNDNQKFLNFRGYNYESVLCECKLCGNVFPVVIGSYFGNKSACGQATCVIRKDFSYYSYIKSDDISFTYKNFTVMNPESIKYIPRGSKPVSPFEYFIKLKNKISKQKLLKKIIGFEIKNSTEWVGGDTNVIIEDLVTGETYSIMLETAMSNRSKLETSFIYTEYNYFEIINNIKKSNTQKNTELNGYFGIFNRQFTRLDLYCNACNKPYETDIKSFVRGTGCSGCASNEALCIAGDIDPYFEDFEIEKKFEDCKNINVLRYDRYVSYINLLLEYDGVQHFNEKNKWYTEDGVTRDQIKTEYAINNGYNFIRIAYYENHVEVLEEFLKLVLANPDKQIVQIYGAVQILDKK